MSFFAEIKQNEQCNTGRLPPVIADTFESQNRILLLCVLVK